ncbi:MAG: phosphatase PAP2 family protein [Chitinophagales bacterium]
MALIIVCSHPIRFAYLQGKHFVIHIGLLIGLMTFYPLFSMLLMRALKIIDSIELEDRKMRFIPMIAVATFWLLAFLMYMPNGKTVFSSNIVLSNMILGSVIAVFLAFFFNALQKISFHTIGMGGLVGMLLQIIPTAKVNLVGFFIAAIILAGVVGSARLYLDAHTKSEVYGGFLIGFFAQFIAYTMYDKITMILPF